MALFLPNFQGGGFLSWYGVSWKTMGLYTGQKLHPESSTLSGFNSFNGITNESKVMHMLSVCKIRAYKYNGLHIWEEENSVYLFKVSTAFFQCGMCFFLLYKLLLKGIRQCLYGQDISTVGKQQGGIPFDLSAKAPDSINLFVGEGNRSLHILLSWFSLAFEALGNTVASCSENCYSKEICFKMNDFFFLICFVFSPVQHFHFFSEENMHQ